MSMATGWKPEVPVLDGDDVDLQPVITEVRQLQESFNLGDADIYRSSEDSYHVYFFHDSERTREEKREIIREADFVDEEFEEFQEKREKTRMRVKGKHDEEIRKVKTIISEYDGEGHPQRAEHLKRTFKRMKKLE